VLFFCGIEFNTRSIAGNFNISHQLTREPPGSLFHIGVVAFF
jgi:hypothetical protein